MSNNSLSSNIYICEFCSFAGNWEDSDEAHGNLWSCDECYKIFCQKCFGDAHGYDEYMKMMQMINTNFILCPACAVKLNIIKNKGVLNG